jgi:nucleoid DNA-binding protein
LRPTKSKDLIKKTAEQLGMSEELVKDVVDFYYSVVIKKIENLESATIFLHGLGTLRLSRKKLEFQIKNLEKLLDSNSQEDFKKVVKYNLSKGMLESKKKALEMCNEYYKEIYEKRYKDLEGKRPNTRRDKE